jgi:hypothetical protein
MKIQFYISIYSKLFYQSVLKTNMLKATMPVFRIFYGRIQIRNIWGPDPDPCFHSFLNKCCNSAKIHVLYCILFTF